MPATEETLFSNACGQQGEAAHPAGIARDDARE
jgi:hypothetical protein